MKKLWIVWLIGLFLAGCGAGGQSGLTEADAETNDEGSGIVAGEMTPSLREKSQFLYEYEVKNQTEKEVTLEFTSSQRYDYSVETVDGEEVFLFSSVASFLQVLGEETVKQGAALTYDIDLRHLNLKPGNYILTAWMTPKAGPAFKVKEEITVE